MTQDEQALAKGERAQVRERVVRHGHGKTVREERLRAEQGGSADLTADESSGEPEQTPSAHGHDFEGQPSNAVVARRTIVCQRLTARSS